jgi:hypothetical protein
MAMRTEESIREALQLEAARHRVNPALPRATRLKARGARALTVVAVAAAVTSLVLGGASLVGAVRDGGERLVGPAGGDAAEEREPAYAYGAPLLLLTGEGWTVTRADQYGNEGEMTFEQGDRSVGLYWRDPNAFEMYVQDRENGAGASWDVTIAGGDARLFQYEGTNEFTALWRGEKHTLELRGAFPDVDAYRAMAATLKWVDDETWLAALPDDTVAPSERAAAVDEMLADIPHRRDGDLAALREDETIIDRYQLGAEVTGAVACAWIGQWLKGIEQDDERLTQTALGAMRSAREWAVLRELKDQGGWSEMVWEYADAMAGDGEVAGGRAMTIEESYRDALGCPKGD